MATPLDHTIGDLHTVQEYGPPPHKSEAHGQGQVDLNLFFVILIMLNNIH